MLRVALKIKGLIISKESCIHAMLYDEAVNLGVITEHYIGGQLIYSEYGEDGFIDEENNFYNREEALNLAIKIHSFKNNEVDLICEHCGGYGLESVKYEELIYSN